MVNRNRETKSGSKVKGRSGIKPHTGFINPAAALYGDSPDASATAAGLNVPDQCGLIYQVLKTKTERVINKSARTSMSKLINNHDGSRSICLSIDFLAGESIKNNIAQLTLKTRIISLYKTDNHIISAEMEC